MKVSERVRALEKSHATILKLLKETTEELNGYIVDEGAEQDGVTSRLVKRCKKAVAEAQKQGGYKCT